MGKMQSQSDGTLTTSLPGTRAFKSHTIEVAVRVRPLSHEEISKAFESCVNVENICTTLVQPLIDEFFDVYNVTVLAYGQTGSGKTYTMGNDFASSVSPSDCGIIPRVIDNTIFERVNASGSPQHFVIKLSYLEVLNEEISDLLVKSVSGTSTVLPTSTGLSVRGDGDRGIVVTGLSEHVVTSACEATAFLRSGAQERATASTSMNTRSSRSHAICTLIMEQHGICSAGGDIESRFSKFHLVDLAGSERVQRTNSEGARFKEGVNINRGLLALGNVISALSKRRNRTKSLKAHIPYRDSKLTRLLEDSLGGNSKTLMIACISPAEVNYKETSNTVRYAFRTRSIENRAIINKERDWECEVESLKLQLETVKAQLVQRKADRPVTNSVHRSCINLRAQLEAQNCKLKAELVRANSAKDKWKGIASELGTKLEGVRKELHMLTQAAKQKASKKRKTRESYETMETLFSSSSEEVDNSEGDSDYADEDDSRNNNRKVRTTHRRRQARTN